MLYQTEGIVLSQEDLDENDKIITLLTRDEGIIKARVKGAKKASSKLSPLTQPFAHGLYQLFRGKSLDRVIQVTLKDSHREIFEDYKKMIYGAYLGELIQEFLPERESNPEVFSFFQRVLSCLSKREDPWPVVRWAELGLLFLSGFSPSFSTCFKCKCDPRGDVIFDFARGSIMCEKCFAEERQFLARDDRNTDSIVPSFLHPTNQIMKISEGTRKTLDLLSKVTLECPSLSARGIVRKEAGLLLERYITDILEKPLKSLRLVETIESEEGKV